VVGTSGTILQSTDPQAFAAESSETTQDLAAVAYGADTWVAVGADGEIVVSGDAEDWSAL